jgi:hypothetical protein
MSAPTARIRTAAIPPLEQGDRLTRDEFERRYHAMPKVKKAELIDGVVNMPSPVRLIQHGSPHGGLLMLLTVYQAYTPGVTVGGNATVRLDLDNEPQPDALAMIEPTHGGQATIDADGYVEGGPELVGEVAASTTSIDLNTKFHVYRRNKVREYIVWRVLDEAIDWFILRGSQYDQLAVNSNGICESEIFPGLWLDAAALLRFDLQIVLQVLQQGIASPAHAAFVTKLRQAAPPTP